MMLTSLGLIFLVGLSLASIVQRLRLPRLVGMLLGGILLGPYALCLLDDSILSISSELRQLALVIILIKAGLSLNIADLKKVGRPAVLMTFVPASAEIIAYVLFAPLLLGISQMEAALMGAVLAAVSPAVVVPRMVDLMERGVGVNKGIPQMIMAGASCDDIFVIVVFTAFANMVQGGTLEVAAFLSIPVSIIMGILLGALAGGALVWLFAKAHQNGETIRNSTKVIVILGVSFLLLAAEEWTKGIVAVSGLLAIAAMACVIGRFANSSVTGRLSQKFGKLWIAAELVLFVLVGAAVDVRYTLHAGFAAVILIFFALVMRSLGVLLCLVKTPLNRRERLFCVIAYLPKATVQAAIGSLPLAMGFSCGAIILSVAVLAILITAPLGAIGIDGSWERLLEKERQS